MVVAWYRAGTEEEIKGRKGGRMASVDHIWDEIADWSMGMWGVLLSTVAAAALSMDTEGRLMVSYLPAAYTMSISLMSAASVDVVIPHMQKNYFSKKFWYEWICAVIEFSLLRN